MRRAAILMLAALAGCTAGPDYHRSAAAISERPAATGAFVSGDEAAFAPAPVPDHWWRLYSDPVLDRLVGEALAANTNLRVAAANIARAEAAERLTATAGDVRTSVSAAPGYAQRSAEEELLPGAALPHSFVYQLGAGVSYQLDLAGQVRRAVEGAQQDVAAARAAYEATRVTVAAGTTAAYVSACAAGREIGVAQRLVALQQRTTALNDQLRRGGRGISLDVTRSQAQEEQVRASLPLLEGERRIALFRLATLTGRPPAEIDAAAAACVREPAIDRPIPIGDGAALLKRRPDVRRAEAQLHAATARIGVATAELYPTVSLGASVGSVGLARKFLAGDTYKFSLGPLISWEFPNRPRVRARVAGAQAEADAAYAAFDGSVLDALRETETALTLYARDLDRVAALRAAQAKAAKAVQDAQTLFHAGRSGFLPVLDAQRTDIVAEQTLAAAESRVAADQVQLFLALGGGWQS